MRIGVGIESVSRVFKDQVFGAFNLFSFISLFGLWSAAIVSEILSFSSKCLYVVVLLHFGKAEFALEGIRQFLCCWRERRGEIEHVL